MKFKTEEKQIGDLALKCTQFPAMHACELLADLIAAVGPSFTALMKLDPSTSIEAAGPDFAMALKTLKGREIVALMPRILEGTSVMVNDVPGGRALQLNTRGNIDLVFSGDLMPLIKALAFALQVNYRTFTLGSALSGTSLPVPSAA